MPASFVWGAGMTQSWQPTARLDALHQRARMLARLRHFFTERSVLEVETPVLSRAAVTSPALDSFATSYTGPLAPHGVALHLHTSPEFFMKRLLAAGSGAIWQLARVFRDGEAGRRHNPEFSLLEWYRPGFDHHQLMDEVEMLVRVLLGDARPLPDFQRVSYRELFRRFAGVDGIDADAPALQAVLRGHGQNEDIGLAPDDLDGWRDLVMVTLIEPQLQGAWFVYDYPASQAALARLAPENPAVAERFELYIDGVELANGFHELTDASEQRARFEEENRLREAQGKASMPLDEGLLAALEAGLPACAGVALGFDRLLMLAMGAASIEEVLSFGFDRV